MLDLDSIAVVKHINYHGTYYLSNPYWQVRRAFMICIQPKYDLPRMVSHVEDFLLDHQQLEGTFTSIKLLMIHGAHNAQLG